MMMWLWKNVDTIWNEVHNICDKEAGKTNAVQDYQVKIGLADNLIDENIEYVTNKVPNGKYDQENNSQIFEFVDATQLNEEES